MEQYLFGDIVPIYNGFDLAHKEDHALTVIDQAMKLLENMPKEYKPVDKYMLLTAAEDHRASGKHAPRSIYGMLVAEADRVIESETIIRRTIQFGLKNYPELDRPAQLDRAVGHLREKYGRGGYLKLWIPWSDNAARLSALQDTIADDDAIYRITAEIFDRLTQ